MQFSLVNVGCSPSLRELDGSQ